MSSTVRDKLYLGARIVLGALFIAASIDKIAHPAAFAEIIHNYQILPDYLINISAIVLPWLEALLGLCIITGVWLPGTVVLANLLLLTFFSALLFNLSRGLNVHCGCFSTKITDNPQTAWYVARDSLFLLLGLSVLLPLFRKRTARRNPV